jgi:steroid delta-isomerase-like uncharacterized protein
VASKNVETLRAAHQAFNRRDFDAVVSMMADTITYVDYARSVTFTGRSEFKQFMQGWATAFSNAEVSEPTYIDGGNVVVAQFTGLGTNDGQLGPTPPSGKSMRLPFCEMFRFDQQGRIVSGGIYYDQLTMMTQLGHLQAAGA